jgi:hypothetical protein
MYVCTHDSKGRFISKGERLLGLNDIQRDIELYTYSESANFSLSYDVYNSISP